MNDNSSRHLMRSTLIDVEFGGTNYVLLLGLFAPMDRIGEIALIGPDDSLVRDACSLLTELLQRYVSLETQAELVCRDDDGAPESVLGAIILTLAQSP